jgi:hypothetical protein
VIPDGSLVRKLCLTLTLSALAVLASACSTSSTEETDTPFSMGIEGREYQPYENTLAVSDRMRSFTLPLNNPGVVPAHAASHMEEDDLIAGVVVNGQARAYPRWMLVTYHVVNDTINDAPIMVAHCEICSGTSAFRPVVEGFGGRSLIFDTYGPAKGTFSVYDYQTHTVWSPFTGRTLEGQLHPSRMERIPVMVQSWGAWMERFPDTEVVFGSRLFIEHSEHGRGEDNEIGAEFIPQGFANVANMEDVRLARSALVFGITNLRGDQSIAFSLDWLEEQQSVVKHPFDNGYYLLEKIGPFAVAAFRLEEDQVDQTYSVSSRSPFQLTDDEGHSWDEFGKASAGGAGGRDLLVADGYLTEWYEWVSSYPASEIAR